MADVPGKKEGSAEKAYAAAAAVPSGKAGKKPVKWAAARKPAGRKATAAAPKAAAVKSAPAPKVSAAPGKAPEPRAAEAPKIAENKAPAAAPVAAEVPQPVTTADTPLSTSPLSTSEEPTMANQPTDFTDTINTAVNEIQARAKTAYDKGAEVASEMTDLARGNVEAVVESGKILAGGVQDLSKGYAEEAKSAYEQLTADLKEMAAVKSPAELFQLQGKILRRNFDTLVATGSRNTEAVMKLANDSFAPISGRINVAAEKLSKVA